MKRVYENFTELANAMCNGEGMLHRVNCPGPEGCIHWQNGVRDFAGWLDHIDAKTTVIDETKDFYSYMREKTK